MRLHCAIVVAIRTIREASQNETLLHCMLCMSNRQSRRGGHLLAKSGSVNSQEVGTQDVPATEPQANPVPSSHYNNSETSCGCNDYGYPQNIRFNHNLESTNNQQLGQLTQLKAPSSKCTLTAPQASY